MKKLSREFYNRKTVEVAKDLLGKLLVHSIGKNVRVGKITEVEAYVGPHDKASHTSRGITPRTKVMFGPPGHAYVYLIYGMHHCFNVVTEQVGHGSGVLIRSLEPVLGVTENTKGPGRLCKAMGLDLNSYGHDLLSKDLFIAEPSVVDKIEIVASPRVGVNYAGEWAKKPLRFYIKGSSYVSKK